MTVSKLVAGNEKFLSLLLGAVVVYVQTNHYIFDPNLKNLISAVLVACQGWLATNSSTDDLVEPDYSKTPIVPTSE